MKKVNTNNKSSVKKKLIPAAGSLMISAAMLGTSTYAWFTMSREVEVTGIKMQATVPEDLQISVGDITAGKYLNDPTSFIQKYTVGTGTTAPTQDNMWSNTVDISQYYRFGRLIPASSTSGSSIFFTPDATKQGQDVKNEARYFAAANGLNAVTSGTSMMATVHAIEDASDEWAAPSGSNYSGAVTWANTQDDGYYADIPVWIRSSSDEAINLTVKGYVKADSSKGKSDASGAQIELYKATRVAILPAAGDTTNATNGTKGLVNLMDGSGTTTGGWKSTTSIIDYYGTSAVHRVDNGAVKAAGEADGSDNPSALNSGTNWTDIYGAAVVYNGTDSVATIAGSGDGTYGTPTMLWIRVWLEGEDPECWNQNAGQDWNISLKFEKI
jgi:hypothetical protein